MHYLLQNITPFAMKRFFFGCFLLVIGSVQAQQPKPVKPVITDESQTILNKMQQKWVGLQSAKISFTLQSSPNGEKSSLLKGTVWTQGKAYKLEIPGQTVYCDGKTVWNYLPENQEVSIADYEENSESISINPLQVIATYDQYYRSAFIREMSEKGVVVQVVDLYPKQGQSFYKIRMVIRKDKLLPTRAVIYEKNGATDTYYFDNILLNPAIKSGFFTFRPEEHPDVEIIDMRE